MSKLTEMVRAKVELGEKFSDTVKKVGKNLAARPNKGAMPGADRVKKMTEEEIQLDEGRVKELAMDLDGPDSIPHNEFQKKYGKSKDEFRKLLNQPAKPKSTPNQVLSKMYSDKLKEGRLLDKRTTADRNVEKTYRTPDAADKDEREYGEPMGVPSGPGKSAPLARQPYETYQGKKMSPKMQKKLALAASLGHVVNGVKKEEVELDEVSAGQISQKSLYDYHKREAARHRESQGWNLNANIYNRNWKKEAAHHEREAKKLGKVLGVKEEVFADYPTLDEEVAENSMLPKIRAMMEGPSLADMHPDNINKLIKQHGKRHMIYTGPGEPMQHGLGFKELKAKLGVGTSGGVHKKFVSHLEKNGFKSSWSHTSNEWVVHPK